MLRLKLVNNKWAKVDMSELEAGEQYKIVPFNTLREYEKGEMIQARLGFRCKCGEHKEKKFKICFRCHQAKPEIKL